MSRLLYTVALIIVLFLSQGDAATSIHQLERNATHVVLQCRTDRSQIIWRGGDTPNFEPDEYDVTGNFVTATATFSRPLTGSITVTCTGTGRYQLSENATFNVTASLEESPTSSGTVQSSNSIPTVPTESPSGTVPSSIDIPTGSESVTEATSTTQRGNTCGARCITDTNNVTETTSKTPGESACGVECIVGIVLGLLLLLLLLLLLVLLAILCFWKREKLVTFCSKTMSKICIHRPPKTGDSHQPGQQTGIPTPPTSPPVTETNSSRRNSTVVIPMSQTGSQRHHDMPVPPETTDNGAVELVVLNTRRQQPHPSTHRKPSVEGLPTNTDNIEDNFTCIPDRRSFTCTAEYGNPTADTVINMEGEEPQ